MGLGGEGKRRGCPDSETLAHYYCLSGTKRVGGVWWKKSAPEFLGIIGGGTTRTNNRISDIEKLEFVSGGEEVASLTHASKLPGETMRPSSTDWILVTRLVMAACSD